MGRVRAGVIAVLAGVPLLLIPAQAAARAVEVEGGRLTGTLAKVVKDPRASGGRAVALSGRGAVRRRVTTRYGLRAVVLRARGVPCAGSPRVAVLLNARRAGSRVVRRRSFRRLRLTVNAGAGLRVVTLRLANPRRRRSCRRTLVLDSLRLVERPRPAPARRAPDPIPAPAPVAAPAAAPGPETPPGGYRNPVFPTPTAPGRPDPMVLDVGDAHSDYLAFTTGDRFPVLRSKDLVRWTPLAPALPARPAWADQTGEWNPWAPSVIESPRACPGSTEPPCFALFHVSKHDATLSPPTNCIGVAVSPTPEGPYQELGPLEFTVPSVDASGRPPGCGDDGGYSNIDPAPFVGADGEAYLYLSTGHKCQAPSPGGECPFDRTISVIPLSPDLLSAAGPRQELFNGATAGWEVASFGPVVENPWPVRTDNGYLLLYSGGAFNGPYGMGYATASTPTGPFVKSADNPVLREREGVLSPGGGMLVTGPRGATWLAYHGRQGAYANPRELRIDPVRFPAAASVAVDGPTSAPQPNGP